MLQGSPELAGAVAPERTRTLALGPLRLCLHEWGDPHGVPLVLCHGMFDHARGFDVLAPLLAERYRVIAIDARGHGDSSWVDTYRYWDDVTDICEVLRSLGPPCLLVGHSKGGSQATEAAAVAPELVRKLVNIDGFGPPLGEMPRRPGEPETLPERLAMFLNYRRNPRDFRPAPQLDELVERRRRANPRLPLPWAQHMAFHAARHTEAGWTWKADPRLGVGFGPWKPEWIAPSWSRLRAPMLAITGTEQDFYGPASEEQLDVRLADVRDVQRARVPGVGHFVHMEAPEPCARLILDFLAE
jgi:pimeloyl-ACP methyl ester carboxylesterase